MVTRRSTWTDADKLFLRENYHTLGWKAVARELGKSGPGVRGMGGLDGIGYAEVPIGVLQTQFMRLYEPLARDEQTQAQLPEAVREFISGAEVKQIAG